MQYETSLPTAACATTAGELADCPSIAFDTEFVSEHTYRPVLCLVQVAAAGATGGHRPAGRQGHDAVLGDDRRAGARDDRPRRPQRGRVLPACGRSRAGRAVRRATGGRPGRHRVSGRLQHAGLALLDEPGQEARNADRLAAPPAVAAANRLLRWRTCATCIRSATPCTRGWASSAGCRGWPRKCDAWLDAGPQHAVSEDRWRRVSGNSGLDGRALAIVRELYHWREAEAQRRNQPRPPRAPRRPDHRTGQAADGRREADRRGPRPGTRRPGQTRGPACRLHRAGAGHARAGVPPRGPRESMPQLPVLGQFLFAALGSLCRQADLAPNLVGGPNDIRELIAYRTSAQPQRPPAAPTRPRLAAAVRRPPLRRPPGRQHRRPRRRPRVRSSARLGAGRRRDAGG